VPDSAQGVGARKRGKAWILLVCWAAVIFATSCTFIDRDMFLGAVLPVLPASAHHGFTVFWDGGGGLVVVKG